MLAQQIHHSWPKTPSPNPNPNRNLLTLILTLILLQVAEDLLIKFDRLPFEAPYLLWLGAGLCLGEDPVEAHADMLVCATWRCMLVCARWGRMLVRVCYVGAHAPLDCLHVGGREGCLNVG